MDTYPRFTIRAFLDPRDDEGHVKAYRVSARRAAEIADASAASRGDDYWPIETREVTPPRFKIKVATWPTPSPIVLFDRSRPAFRGQYRTLDAAFRAMDNTVRRERGMPERIDWTRVEIKTPPLTQTRPAHYGQHVQGCVSCYAYLDDALKGAAERAGLEA